MSRAGGYILLIALTFLLIPAEAVLSKPFGKEYGPIVMLIMFFGFLFWGLWIMEE